MPLRGIARVLHVDLGNRVVALENRNGQYLASFDEDGYEELTVGDVVLVTDDGQLETTTSAAWPAVSFIGIVKHTTPTETIVSINGNLRSIPASPGVQFDKGNTVEADEINGVRRVVSKDPIRSLDHEIEISDDVIQSFIVINNSGRRLSYEDFGGSPSIVRRAQELIESPLLHREELDTIGGKHSVVCLISG